MTEIDFLPPKKSWIQEIQKSDWIILTSGAAARTLPQIMGDLRTLHGKRIAVVGKSTAAILGALGLRADFVGPGPGSMALARAWPGKKSESILHLTGNAEEGGLVKVMRRMGYPTQRIEVYRNRLPPCLPKPVLSALRQAGADWVVFASGTAAQRLRRLVGKTAMPRIKTVEIETAANLRPRRPALAIFKSFECKGSLK
ncbi:uroporphyrinogen-III synthase [bacterium]|nr:uroporphyrinogen-III synthase [bacterium]